MGDGSMGIDMLGDLAMNIHPHMRINPSSWNI